GVATLPVPCSADAPGPPVGIENRASRVQFNSTQIAFDRPEEVRVLLYLVSVCFDNESRHFVCLLMVCLTSSMNNLARHLSSFPRRRESRPFVFLDSGSPPAKSGLAGMTVGNMQ